MKIFNPCKKCLVQACCSNECQEHYEHTVLMNNVNAVVTYIPTKILNFILAIIKELKFLYMDEPLFIQCLITVVISLMSMLVIVLVVMMVITIRLLFGF